jgi:hypothetical protein
MMKLMLLILMTLASVAHGQIGWTLDRCRKAWGRETGIKHPYLDESQTTTGTTYVFGSLESGSELEKWVALDPQGKVNDLYYIGPSKPDSEGIGVLKIAKLLEKEEGVIWPGAPAECDGNRHGYWIGYNKDGVEVFQAYYYMGKRDVNALTWGESLHVVPF